MTRSAKASIASKYWLIFQRDRKNIWNHNMGGKIADSALKQHTLRSWKPGWELQRQVAAGWCDID